ncbi:MAG: hypothetical protein ACLFPD_06305 [Desulfosudaceae bacterium]
MILIQIILFFVLLFAFFGVSALWHRAWFGGRPEKPSGTVWRWITVALVAGDLAGLYWVIYLLLT